MNKDRFQYVCQESEAGNDAFVTHPETGEEGRVVGCAREHVVVETVKGEKRCWDYRECEEISRSKEEFPWR